jgi:hypothetical protein
MDLTPYLDMLRNDLAVAAKPGGPATAEAADLLSHALEASARLALLEALSDAAAEITTRLHDASVEVRLRGREADLVVNHVAAAIPEPGPEAPAADGGELARLTLRMPEALKTHIEQTAAAAGISVNAWLVRAVTGAINQPLAPHRSGKRITGFAQA